MINSKAETAKPYLKEITRMQLMINNMRKYHRK
jgi:hypothetical protein